MKERLFRFKQFSVSHRRSAMKVGVDGVLIGAWAGAEFPGVEKPRILDVGTGCGLIALIMAQRCPTAVIEGVDTHRDSVEEAQENFLASPWSDRLSAGVKSFPADFTASDSLTVTGSDGFYDLIISNPPFFAAGMDPGDTDCRVRSRHAAELSPLSLLAEGSKLLRPGGRIAQITPPEWRDALLETAREHGLRLSREAILYSTPSSQPKRILTEFTLRTYHSEREDKAEGCDAKKIIIQTAPETYTDQYRNLTGELYIKF